jgi:hypothetical protein
LLAQMLSDPTAVAADQVVRGRALVADFTLAWTAAQEAFIKARQTPRPMAKAAEIDTLARAALPRKDAAGLEELRARTEQIDRLLDM